MREVTQVIFALIPHGREASKDEEVEWKTLLFKTNLLNGIEHIIHFSSREEGEQVCLYQRWYIWIYESECYDDCKSRSFSCKVNTPLIFRTFVERVQGFRPQEDATSYITHSGP